MIKISLIIPAYNAEKTLKTTVESALQDRLDNLEIIIVNDGSSDDTESIAQDLIKKHHQVRYYRQKNQGASAARNSAISQAEGEYIAFLDSDDELLEGSLRSRMKFLDLYPNAGLVFTDYFMVHAPEEHLPDEGRLNKVKFRSYFSKQTQMEGGDAYTQKKMLYKDYLFIRPNPILISTVMMRRSVVEKVGVFNLDLWGTQDRDYWMRIMKVFLIGFLDKPLLIYKRYESYISNKRIPFMLCNIHGLKLFLKDKELPSRKISVEISDCFYQLGHFYMEENKFWYAKIIFLKGLFYHAGNYRCWIYLLSLHPKMGHYMRDLGRKKWLYAR